MKAICSHFQRLAVLVPLVVCAAGGVSQQALAGQSDIGTSASPLGIPPGPPPQLIRTPACRRAISSICVLMENRLAIIWLTRAFI